MDFKLQRYNILSPYDGYMIEDPRGEWVKFEDAERFINNLRQELSTVQHEMTSMSLSSAPIDYALHMRYWENEIRLFQMPINPTPEIQQKFIDRPLDPFNTWLSGA